MIRVSTEREARQLAQAAGMDAGNRTMRKAGRKAWSKADYNASCREWLRVYRALVPDAEMRCAR